MQWPNALSMVVSGLSRLGSSPGHWITVLCSCARHLILSLPLSLGGGGGGVNLQWRGTCRITISWLMAASCYRNKALAPWDIGLMHAILCLPQGRPLEILMGGGGGGGG